MDPEPSCLKFIKQYKYTQDINKQRARDKMRYFLTDLESLRNSGLRKKH